MIIPLILMYSISPNASFIAILNIIFVWRPTSVYTIGEGYEKSVSVLTALGYFKDMFANHSEAL
jgi:hypothetical protein